MAERRNVRRELLTTVGLRMPDDFDAASYERFWKRVSLLPSSDARTKAGFGKNAVAYRFCRPLKAIKAFNSRSGNMVLRRLPMSGICRSLCSSFSS